MIAALALWLAVALLVGWLAGRFIRAGMVDMERDECPRDAT